MPGILHRIEFVQLAIPAGALNGVCPATEGWGIQEIGVFFHKGLGYSIG